MTEDQSDLGPTRRKSTSKRPTCQQLKRHSRSDTSTRRDSVDNSDTEINCDPDLNDGEEAQEEGMPSFSSSNNEQESRARIRHYIRRHSVGSSINLSFDSSTSTQTSDLNDSSTSSDNNSFREELLSHPDELRMYVQEKLAYHFMNPIEKWRTRRVFPYKLILQLLKIVVVTVQILLFGSDSIMFQTQHTNTCSALKMYFLQDWNTLREIVYYPSSDGPYAVFSSREFYGHLDHVLRQYAFVTKRPIGSFGYDDCENRFVPARLCINRWDGAIFPFNESIRIDSKSYDNCTLIDPPGLSKNDHRWQNFSSEAFMKERFGNVPFELIFQLEVQFVLKTIYRRTISVYDPPGCYRLITNVLYDNKLHDGEVPIKFEIESKKLDCHDEFDNGHHDTVQYWLRQSLNCTIIVMCVVSFILCSRSLFRTYELRNKTVEYFEVYLKKQLKWSDQMDFIDMWMITIMVNDVLIIIGSAIKIEIDRTRISGSLYNICSVILGTGALCVYCGILRYITYFKTYNILILTLKNSTPNLLKSGLCAAIIFLAYSICGWVVLGPYHDKFKSLHTSAECLFAITNGDDIFATFALETNAYATLEIPITIWIFARVYLYSFVVLYICVVVNLLMAVILDAYDVLRDQVEDVPSAVQEFIRADWVEEASSVVYREDERDGDTLGTFECFKSCCGWWKSDVKLRRSRTSNSTSQSVLIDDT